MRSTAVLALLSAMTGACWGIVAWLFGARAFGPAIHTGVVASPLIGLAVGCTTQRWWESSRPRARTGIGLVSLYLGVVLFGVAVAVWDWWPGGVGQSALGSLGEGIGTAVIGVTLSGFVILFWPLAYLTHRFIAHLRGVALPS